MIKKVLRYVVTNSEGDYLSFNQIDGSGVEVFTTDSIEQATLFTSYSDALNEGYNLKFGTGTWEYYAGENCVPADVTKVKIETEKLNSILSENKNG